MKCGGGGDGGGPRLPGDTERAKDLTVIYVAGWPSDGAEAVLLWTREMH